MKNMPKIYVGMTIDIVHHGHINIIENARKHGDVIIGLLTDQAIANHIRLPYLSWDNRKRIVENINGVNMVVPQEEWDYAPNLLKYKPDFMIHGSDWVQGPLLPYRELAVKALDSYGGKLIEIDYTEGVSSTKMNQQIQELGTTSEIRRKTLRRLLASKKICRFLEAHNPISALIVENSKIIDTEGNFREFHGFWSSSLTDSTSMGKPDIEALDINTRLENIDNIFDVTTKPLIMDADTGGKLEHFELHVKSMERLGISATIIEDKTGLKKNSLFGNDVEQSQDDIESFCAKIKAGRAARVGDDFMIIARIESLILEKGMDDALNRAFAYANVGVDGIMIHSRKKTPDEIFEFAKLFRKKYPNTPLICVPTSYNIVTEEELESAGFNIVIYANHLLRAAFPAMQGVANQILTNSRSLEVDKQLMSINDILESIPGTK